MNRDVLIFGNEKIQRIWKDVPKNGHDSGEFDWFFSVVDVVGVLTESSVPKRYLKGKVGDKVEVFI